MMKDMDVGNALRRLPRTTPSPSFTSDVMRAARQNSSRPSARFEWLTPAVRFVAVTSLMLILVVGAYATSIHRQRVERIRTLRAEHQRIESELQRVKEVADEAQPAVVLENGDTRVIVDVKQNRQTKPIYY
jgi:hypothetical protein